VNSQPHGLCCRQTYGRKLKEMRSQLRRTSLLIKGKQHEEENKKFAQRVCRVEKGEKEGKGDRGEAES
jgi:hypothetical protein